MHLLIVEDDTTLCVFLEEILQRDGYRTTIKTTGTAALEALHNDSFDALILDRMLPKIDRGDLLVIHDTGAHGFSMGYNYNGKLKSAEVLLKEDGSTQLIRRAETPEDYFRTFDCFDILKDMKHPK